MPQEQESHRLTPAGAARRDGILRILHAAQAQRRQRRRVLRAGAFAACLVLVSTVAFVASTPTRLAPHRAAHARASTPSAAAPPRLAEAPPAHTPSAAPKISPRILVITGPTVALTPCGEAAASTQGPPPAATGPATETSVCLMSDDELLTVLAEAGEPAALVRAGGRTELLRVDKP